MSAAWEAAEGWDPRRREAKDRDRARYWRKRVRWLGVSGFHRERADLRGFGYPRYNGASCPHTLGSDLGGENKLPARPERYHAWAGRPVPDNCRPPSAAVKEQKSSRDVWSPHTGGTGTCESKAQTKPASSRARATVTFAFMTPRPIK